MIILKESHTGVIGEMHCVKGNERVVSTTITSCIVIIGLNAERKINAAHLLIDKTYKNIQVVLDDLTELFSGCSNIVVIGQLDFWGEDILYQIYSSIGVTGEFNRSEGEYIVSANVSSDSLEVYVDDETVTFGEWSRVF